MRDESRSERQAECMRGALAECTAGSQSDLDENGVLCVLQGRLYLASLAGEPVSVANKHFITLKKMRYIPFCADFGPFNLGMPRCRAREREHVRVEACARCLDTCVATAPRIAAPTCLLEATQASLRALSRVVCVPRCVSAQARCTTSARR